MRPEETPVITRVAGVAPGAEPDQASAILAAIDLAIEEHSNWLRRWHRAVICRLPEAMDDIAGDAPASGHFAEWYEAEHERELVSQQIFQELWAAYRDMREFGRALLPKAVAAGSLETGAYDAFARKIGNFERLARRVRQAFQQAALDLDPLTGVRSRRNLMDELEREKARSLRMGTTFAVALCDIDHFKEVNDTYGHSVGDAVLVSVVSRLVSKLRPYDSIFRYGGEEFLIALPDSTLSTAMAAAERLCHTVRSAPVVIEGGPAVDASISLGVCIVDDSLALSDAIERSDQALYAAKYGGRDRVVAWEPSLRREAGE
jgi:diguanylate cyclase (GGDEF)-like protein